VVNVSRVDLNLFVVLDAIYTEGGITRASEVYFGVRPADPPHRDRRPDTCSSTTMTTTAMPSTRIWTPRE